MLLNVVILAAGQGKRMRSQLPKVLHSIGGKPILEHIIQTTQKLYPQNCYVICGHGSDVVCERFSHLPVQWIHQEKQLGTAHAVAQALPHIDSQSRVLILLGDAPLISVETLQRMLRETPEDGMSLVTVKMPDPTGLGRIIRDEQGTVIEVVEDKDATEKQRKIQEINTGLMLIPAEALKRWLPQINNHNAQGEYYLPDIIPLAIKEGRSVKAVVVESPIEVQGINDRIQLAFLERDYQKQMAKELMLSGVTLLDPNRFDLRGELDAAEDVTIDINVIIKGKVVIGKNSYIGPNTILENVTIGDNVEIKSNCVIEDAVIASHCIIGPFARVRPGTVLADGVHIGNFVEVKKTTVGAGSKINHLSYVGDAMIGAHVNIGAGTITCNYDGANKHSTVIGDYVFVGSNTALVAPLTIGENATIGAGSTITKDAPADALTLRRPTEQKSVNNWRRPQKKEKG